MYISLKYMYIIYQLVIQWGFYIWDWCRQPLFFCTVQELCSEHVTLFICLLVFYVQY